MEIVITARHTDVADRFRRHAQDKLSKVEQLAPRASRLDVEISHENNRRQASQCERVELTVRDKGPVIRAEACADDLYAALDLAHAKLLERLRRARDRRKVHHGRRTPTAVHEATGPLAEAALDEDAAQDATGTAAQDGAAEHPLDAIGDSPVVIREKTHSARPMTLEDALYEMELVGHDFYLFVDAANGCPSVVYRRRGWSYGVIRLDSDGTGEAAEPAEEQVAAG
ncbi:ribosome-associated translation inhibitor RaiA [Kineosporiaceae bacterium SCSIO 59966]|nr:ribosome-associated translation inhibitor RaiA [Kineosporiaceae bacterium SCSIO 59966]